MKQSARTARQIIKTRRAEGRAARTSHTLKSHAIRAGLEAELAGGIAGALRAKGKQPKVQILGCPVARMFRPDVTAKHGKRVVHNGRRFTRDEFRALVCAYNPRAARLVAARETLLAY
jgi:hypothetical protein